MIRVTPQELQILLKGRFGHRIQKDIAKIAKVTDGQVSNVIAGRKKSRLVMAVIASKLGDQVELIT